MFYDSDFFYTKTATIKTKGQATYNRGLLTVGEGTEINILCDIQPTTKEQILKETGIEIDAEYALYCDVRGEITPDSQIIVGGKTYEIRRIIQWDDYMIVYLKRIV